MSADEGRNIEEIAADNASLRSELRAKSQEAAKVPAFQREHDRLKTEAEQLKGKIKAHQEDLHDRDDRIGVLESELREKAQMESAKNEAEQKAKEAVDEREQAQAELAEAKAQIEDLKHEADSRENYIGHLKRHEEHTKLHARLNDLTKELG